MNDDSPYWIILLIAGLGAILLAFGAVNGCLNETGRGFDVPTGLIP